MKLVGYLVEVNPLPKGCPPRPVFGHFGTTGRVFSPFGFFHPLKGGGGAGSPHLVCAPQTVRDMKPQSTIFLGVALGRPGICNHNPHCFWVRLRDGRGY